MCGSWGKGSHLGSQGARPATGGKRRAVGFIQWRRIDVAGWPKMQETGSPHLEEMFMHKVSVIVHCVAVIQYDHNRNRASLYYLFQENKSFSTEHHLHSYSDLREVVSSTVRISYSSAIPQLSITLLATCAVILIKYPEVWLNFIKILMLSSFLVIFYTAALQTYCNFVTFRQH